MNVPFLVFGGGAASCPQASTTGSFPLLRPEGRSCHIRVSEPFSSFIRFEPCFSLYLPFSSSLSFGVCRSFCSRPSRSRLSCRCLGGFVSFPFSPIMFLPHLFSLRQDFFSSAPSLLFFSPFQLSFSVLPQVRVMRLSSPFFSRSFLSPSLLSPPFFRTCSLSSALLRPLAGSSRDLSFRSAAVNFPYSLSVPFVGPAAVGVTTHTRAVIRLACFSAPFGGC